MTPQQEQEKFYYNLGLALAQWQHIEIGLFRVYLFLLETEKQLAINASFHAVQSAQAKLDMTDMVVRAEIASKTKRRQWDKLKERVESQMKIRNRIAHFGVLVETRKPVGRQYKLRPHVFNAAAALKAAQKGGQLTTYTHKGLHKIAKDFGRLSQDLENFARSIRPPSKPQESSSA